MKIARLVSVCVLASASVAWGQGIVDPAISGNTVTAGIALPGGIGADLTLTFEQAVGLNLATLGLSAELVNPSSVLLTSRFPAGGLVNVPSAFPVLVRVSPTAASTLSFAGVYTLSLHTHNLVFAAGSPLRLFAAHDGGPFEDVSDSMGVGSYRTRGTGGSFSEFLILVDLRPVDTVIGRKFDAAEAVLDAAADTITPAVLAELNSTLAAARASWAGGATLDAIAEVNAFAAAVGQHSGADIPDVWRANTDAVNVAGELRAIAAALAFSLNLKANQ